MSNIDKQARQVQRFANYGVDMMEWADGGYVKHSDYLALLDELEAAEKRIAELEARKPDLYLCRVNRGGEELYSPCGKDYPRGRGYFAAAGKGE
ncbi:hypothetical protein [Enterobacter ludwigii]|uniref:hypothetical protein n=1 Tax=Enterobacter ludwigii TaxID=299767 RepID=UPI0022E7BD8E|nr:hypothetical protein [Enterobacter ludwigii]